MGGWSIRARTFEKSRVRAFQWEQRQHGHGWRADFPYLVDLDLAFGPVIEELKPDVIHANDIMLIGAAAQSAARLRLQGHRTRWIYDAHEYVRGVEWAAPEQRRAYPAAEEAFIGRADAVVTVSDQIAELLRRTYDLPRTPLVVRNTPIRESVGTTDPRLSVRTAVGVGEGVPLLVYSGGVAPGRGIATVIEALPGLPDCHLAIVFGRTSAELVRLLARAEELGVQDRVHVLPYVPQHAVPDYLASADLGLICNRRKPNHELSLPTKLAEYVHARLAVVTSDVRTLSEFVERHGIGEVFRADDSEDFAAAVTRALAKRDELRGRITESMLDELSWERQSDGLLRLYREVSGVAPDRPSREFSWSVEEIPEEGSEGPADALADDSDTEEPVDEYLEEPADQSTGEASDEPMDEAEGEPLDASAESVEEPRAVVSRSEVPQGPDGEIVLDAASRV